MSRLRPVCAPPEMMLIIGSGRIAVEFSGAAARYRGCPAAAAQDRREASCASCTREVRPSFVPLPGIDPGPR
jgi:hypothetical protein